MTRCWFPEPDIDDPTEGRPGETIGKWLQRSTWERAKQLRDFYNRNLAALPPEIADRLAREIERDRRWRSTSSWLSGGFLSCSAPSPSSTRCLAVRAVRWTGWLAFRMGLCRSK
jgi:hypothetical protein